MTILNNSAAIMTLGQLNKNITKVGKAITKVSTGQKINSASDDASGYGISEKMRVQIRGLEQAVSNIQNDSAMMKTAEGAVTSTLEIVRHMKEKAIDAANDSNSDDDRRTIQKEIDQCIDQVNENAQIKFNGKTLLDGSTSPLYMNMTDDKEAVIRGLSSAWINDALTLIDESWGINFNQPDNIFHKMQVKFVGANESEPSSDANAVAYVSASTNSDSLTLCINMDQVKNLD
ncbi:MAG: flagellin, partial [Selenomonadaceae bacterium]|nr:flagellin [Selenomonadaceae bacterium]